MTGVRDGARRGSRWSAKEDLFIHSYFDAVGDYIGPHDLGRPAGAAARRAAFLKKSGAWDALTRRVVAERDYLRATGVRLIEDEAL